MLTRDTIYNISTRFNFNHIVSRIWSKGKTKNLNFPRVKLRMEWILEKYSETLDYLNKKKNFREIFKCYTVCI